VLDIRADLDNGEICNVEMQVAQKKNIEKRILYYWSKLYSSGIKEGEDYIKLPKTIAILITNFEVDIAKSIPKFHTKWEIREEEYSKVILSDVLEIHIIDLLKLTKQLEEDIIEANDKVALWAKFIINPDMLEEEEMSVNEDIKKANEELEKIQEDDHEKYLAHLRLKHIMDTKAIETYNYEKGINDTKEEVILNLHKMNMKIEEICEIVNLPKEEVENIIKENKTN